MKKFLIVFLALLGIGFSVNAQITENSTQHPPAIYQRDAGVSDFDTTVMETQWEYSYYANDSKNHADSRFLSILVSPTEFALGGWQQNIRQSTDTAKYDLSFTTVSPSTGQTLTSVWNYYTRGVPVYANFPGGLIRNGSGYIIPGSVEQLNLRSSAFSNALSIASNGGIIQGKYYFINPVVNIHVDASAPATDGALLVGNIYVGTNSSIWLARINNVCDTIWTKTFSLDVSGNDIHPIQAIRCANGDYAIIYNGPATSGTYFERIDSNGNYLSSRLWSETLWDESLVAIGENDDGTFTLVGTQLNSNDAWWFVDHTDRNGSRLSRNTYGTGVVRAITRDNGGWVAAYITTHGDGRLCRISPEGNGEWDYGLNTLKPYAVEKVSDSLYVVAGEAYNDSTGYMNNSAGLYRLRRITIPTLDVTWANVTPLVGNQIYVAPDHIRFAYMLDSPSDIEISVYTSTGLLVGKWNAGYRVEGINYSMIPAEALSSGSYLYEVMSETNRIRGQFNITR